jgi:radical SAM superfamily enzyme YgiQ (UPF0313 family)
VKTDRKKSKILLIAPYPESGLTDMREPPHGLAYIASFLRTNGYEVTAINAKHHCLKSRTVVEEAVNRNPDMVGITAMTPDVIWAGKIAAGIKAALPHVPLIIGGPHANALPAETLKEFPAFDVAALREGEFTMLELAENLEREKFASSLNEIKGIAYKEGKKVLITPPREDIQDLDSLPFPAWDLFPSPHIKGYPIIAARGCPFNCKFCQRVLGNRLRRRSAENIVNELDWVFKTFGTKNFWFADETFGVNPQRTNELLDHMIERRIPHRATWHAQTRVDVVNSDLFIKMKKAGCTGIGMGVESGNQAILNKTGKGITLKGAERAVSMAKKAGLKTLSFFILGHPYETLSTIEDTISFAAKLNTDYVSFAVMVPYPGTKVWELAKRQEAGYSYVSENWDDFRKHLSTPLGFASITPDTLRRLDMKAYLIFYLRNHRWLDLINVIWQHKLSIKAFVVNRIKDLVTHIFMGRPKSETVKR